MKKTFISFLVLTLILGNSSVVKAASSDNKIKVSLTNIKEIMLDNSLAMKSLDNSLKKEEDNYDNLNDEVDDLNNQIDNYTPSDDDTSDNTLSELQKKLDTAKEQLTNEKYTLKTAKINYKQQVEDKVYQVQQDYISYLTTLSDKTLMEDKIKIQERELRVSRLKYDSGFISQKDFIASNENNTDLQNQAKALDDKEALAKTKLCNELGIKNNDDVIFDNDNSKDFQVISQTNYDDDLDEMLGNNLDIKQKNIAIDKLDENDNSDSDYDMDNAEISLKLQKQTSETSFKEQYNTLMNSYNSVKASYEKIIEQQRQFSVTQTKCDYGFISEKDLDNAKLQLDTQISTFQADRNKLYLNYLHYIQMKEGY